MTRTRRRNLGRRSVSDLDEITALALRFGRLIDVIFGGDLERVRLTWEAHRKEILSELTPEERADHWAYQRFDENTSSQP